MNISNLDTERQQLILNSALKEFATQGYDHASTNEIAKNAGISKALMFHYIQNKETLFLYLIDYCKDKINTEYLEKMTFDEPDIFKRLQQSFLLQIDLMKEHPWIFDFNKLSVNTKSKHINSVIQKQLSNNDPLCFQKIFENTSETNFRKDLSVDRCKQLILSNVLGFSNQILEILRVTEYANLDFNELIDSIILYFKDLRTIFCNTGDTYDV
ncbi:MULTISPECIES: TetR/AcrR family transcriptional regulator [unclassified Breznakia]|uniref:TetR/AcrR family transcriptional regulator n=1 Tax=unclassified Breznakia TaxID=2623764 RepID=UPI002407564C|nr:MULTISPECIES: TetR/AcrR family transcriptional regulator [unclassified Breznakia]